MAWQLASDRMKSPMGATLTDMIPAEAVSHLFGVLGICHFDLHVDIYLFKHTPLPRGRLLRGLTAINDEKEKELLTIYICFFISCKTSWSDLSSDFLRALFPFSALQSRSAIVGTDGPGFPCNWFQASFFMKPIYMSEIGETDPNHAWVFLAVRYMLGISHFDIQV